MKKLILLVCLSTAIALAMPAPNTATINFNVIYDFAANPDVSSFIVYSGLTSSNYTSRTIMGLATNFAIGGYPRNKTIYFNMTAISTNGVEADFIIEQSTNTWNKPHALIGFTPTQL